MNEIITQVGVGGIFTILILRIVFEFLAKYRNNNGKAKTNCISRTEFDRLKDGVQFKDNCSEIVKRFDGNFKIVEKRFDNTDKQFNEVKEMIKNNHH